MFRRCLKLIILAMAIPLLAEAEPTNAGGSPAATTGAAAVDRPAARPRRAPAQAVATPAASEADSPAAAATNQPATNAAPVAAAAAESSLAYYFRLGGLMMFPLLLLSIAGMGIIIERAWVLRKKRLAVKPLIAATTAEIGHRGIPGALSLLERESTPLAAVLASGLVLQEEGPDRIEKTIETNGGIEISTLERGLPLLAAIANLAPLIGFLGTVTGMIAAFQSIASADTVSAKLVSAGIFEALVSTAVGLFVAIPAFAFHNLFVHRIDRFAVELEKGASEILHAVFVAARAPRRNAQAVPATGSRRPSAKQAREKRR